MSGKFGDLINQARQQETKEVDGKQETKKNRNTEIPTAETSAKKQSEELDIVTLNIKIERKYRQHWMGQAKLQGLTIKDVIVSHLTEKFGLPE